MNECLQFVNQMPLKVAIEKVYNKTYPEANERRKRERTMKFLQLGNGEWISKVECEALKEKFTTDVLNDWDEFEQSLTDEQRKQLHAE